ncbi:MAG: ROK family protein [Anaerolineaceae bacterium]|nr:ROK family protein [Anaerolineaceae bacterium]
MSDFYGAIEAGGTKFNCIIASGPDQILAETRIKTTQPGETLKFVLHFFQEESRKLNVHIKGLGIACFGPLDLNQKSDTYGFITATTKAGWANTDVVGFFEANMNCPVAFNTDVNGAAYGEYLWGAAQDLDSFLYLTIGTGVGGGGMIGGKLLQGLVHPEMGHMKLPHNIVKDPFEGVCPFHGDCFEGMTSGPAIEARWGIRAENLPEDHPAWELEAEYLAMAMQNLICLFSPQKIILGGGVMHQTHLFPLLHGKTLKKLAGYVQNDLILHRIEDFIVPTGLGDRSGVLGALGLGMKKPQ